MHNYTTKELILELKSREEGKRKARVIWTKACQRNCSYCSNTFPEIIAQMQPLTDLTTLADRDEIMITGGEPLLNPPKLIAFLIKVREACPTSKIYLYTAYARGTTPMQLQAIMELTDGIHYTLHADASPDDIIGFQYFQSYANVRKSKSFRLSLDPKLPTPLEIIPAVWKEIRIKEWFSADNCPVPLDETLHLWKGK